MTVCRRLRHAVGSKLIANELCASLSRVGDDRPRSGCRSARVPFSAASVAADGRARIRSRAHADRVRRRIRCNVERRHRVVRRRCRKRARRTRRHLPRSFRLPAAHHARVARHLANHRPHFCDRRHAAVHAQRDGVRLLHRRGAAGRLSIGGLDIRRRQTSSRRDRLITRAHASLHRHATLPRTQDRHRLHGLADHRRRGARRTDLLKGIDDARATRRCIVVGSLSTAHGQRRHHGECR